MTNPLVMNAGIVTILMLTIWIGSIRCRNASIVDAFWGLGFVLVVWTTFLMTNPQQRSLVLPVLTTIWGVRLSLFLAWRNWGLPEDFRYRSMRDKHGPRFWFAAFADVQIAGGRKYRTAWERCASLADRHRVRSCWGLGTGQIPQHSRS